MLWNPWHGCHKCSPGCMNCYVFYLDGKRGKDAGIVSKSKSNFNLPIKKDRSGAFKIPPGSQTAVCFTSDFFISEADLWRDEAWEIIKQRPDVDFLICTKRIERVNECLPPDWQNGYDNVIMAVTCENQQKTDERLPQLLSLKAKRKCVLAAPLLENINFDEYLGSREIDSISVGGESYDNARICDFDWVRNIKRTCDLYGVKFDFHQTGSNFLMDGRIYNIKHRDEYRQAKKGMEYLNREGKTFV